jgi:hypothetical protein
VVSPEEGASRGAEAEASPEVPEAAIPSEAYLKKNLTFIIIYVIMTIES